MTYRTSEDRQVLFTCVLERLQVLRIRPKLCEFLHRIEDGLLAAKTTFQEEQQ